MATRPPFRGGASGTPGLLAESAIRRSAAGTADRPARPTVHTPSGATQDFTVPAEITQRLKQLAQRCDGTLFMALVAACQVLFHRWSGQDDITVGTAVSGRDRAELEDIIGFFVNTVALRTKVAGQRTFRELLSRVRATVLDAFAHQEVPFERVVDELQLPRDTSRTPVFQAMVVLQNTPGHAVALPGLAAEALTPPARHRRHRRGSRVPRARRCARRRTDVQHRFVRLGHRGADGRPSGHAAAGNRGRPGPAG